MNNLVSVIVPAYNVEKYLSRCLDSILAQTYKYIEVIIVDDGATDKTGEIADQYAKRFKNIRCIHKKNGGLSDARNSGMECVRGEYVLFVDSDDWIESNLIEDNLQLMLKNDVEVIVWGYYADFVDDKEVTINTIEINSPEGCCRKNVNPEMLIEKDVLGLVGYAWNKMYSVNLLKRQEAEFVKGLSLVEDILFNVPVLLAAEKIYFHGKAYTHYVQRGRETLGTKYYDNWLELNLLACDKRKELLLEFGLDRETVEVALWERYFYSYITTIRMINRQSIIGDEKKYKMTKSIVEQWQISSNNRFNKSIRFKTSVMFILFRLHLYKLILYVLR